MLTIGNSKGTTKMQQVDLSEETSDDILKRAKILVVDDVQANVRLLELILKRAGYQNLHCTTDSRETIELFDTFQPDLLLLDLNMPYMDGFEVIRQCRAQDKAPRAQARRHGFPYKAL